MITRRNVLPALAFGSAAAVLSRAAEKAPVILLRSGWQTVNIGDIAHTPGVLTVIERNVPAARVILWAGRPLDRGAEPMLRKRFPKLEIIETSAGGEGEPVPAELQNAFRTADLFLHGSAAGISSQPQM
ncbi:MAG: hypothetical protein ACRD7E_05200 [Bryobacteraceae bacterium]